MAIQCKRCKLLKEESEYRNIGRRTTSMCADCREAALALYHSHNAKHRGKYTALQIQRSRAERMLVMQRYGSVCKCCGEDDVRFLTLDHVAGNGVKHRAEMGKSGGRHMVRWAINNGFPKSLQLLCFNCNCGRAVNGGVCPHNQEKVVVPVEPVSLRTTRKRLAELKHLVGVPRSHESLTTAAKLTEDDVRAIRRRADGGETLTSIAKDFPVNLQNIWHIARRKTWKKVI